MGSYGPVEPGTPLEDLAMAGLRDMQRESILKTMFLAESASEVKPEQLQKTWNSYIGAADPFAEEEIKKADEKKKQTLQNEIKKGSFSIVPLVDLRDDQVILRKGPRLRKAYAIRKKVKS